jgi:hypothetical protein
MSSFFLLTENIDYISWSFFCMRWMKFYKIVDTIISPGLEQLDLSNLRLDEEGPAENIVNELTPSRPD